MKTECYYHNSNSCGHPIVTFFYWKNRLRYVISAKSMVMMFPLQHMTSAFTGCAKHVACASGGLLYVLLLLCSHPPPYSSYSHTMPRSKGKGLDLDPESLCFRCFFHLYPRIWLTNGVVYIEVNGTGLIACKVCPPKSGALRTFRQSHITGPNGHENSKQHKRLAAEAKERALEGPFA